MPVIKLLSLSFKPTLLCVTLSCWGYKSSLCFASWVWVRFCQQWVIEESWKAGGERTSSRWSRWLPAYSCMPATVLLHPGRGGSFLKQQLNPGRGFSNTWRTSLHAPPFKIRECSQLHVLPSQDKKATLLSSPNSSLREFPPPTFNVFIIAILSLSSLSPRASECFPQWLPTLFLNVLFYSFSYIWLKFSYIKFSLFKCQVWFLFLEWPLTHRL